MTTVVTYPPLEHEQGDRASLLGVGPALAWAAVIIGVLWLGLLATPDPPGNASAEAGFARDMAVHHAQAVGMAEVVRSRTKDPELRALATDIALTQQSQIGRLKGWLGAWGLGISGRKPAMAWMGHPVEGRMPGMATPDEVAAIAAGSPDQGDIAFLRAMIPHHRGGVLMARGVLARTNIGEVRRFAEAVAASQRSEIGTMEQLLLRRGASPVTAAVTLPPLTEHGHPDGFFGSVLPASRDTIRLLPLSLGAFAAVWLACQALNAGRAPAGHVGGPGALALRKRAVVTGAALGLAGALHLGLSPEHFEQSTAYGFFFVGAALLELAVAAAVIGGPRRTSALAAGVVAAALVSTYGVFRIMAPPGATQAEHVEMVGVATQWLQVAAGFGAWTLYRSLAGRSA